MATAAATVNGLAHRPSGRRRRRRRPLLWQLRTLLAPRHLYGPVKATMLADGHAVAAGLVVAAVLANHVRRVLAPWLGQFLWWHPVQMMRLARATPHFFIEQQLRSATDDAAAAALGLWALQTGALAATRALLRHRLLADDASQHWLRSRGVKGNGNGGGGGSAGRRRRGGSGDNSRARSSKAQAGRGATTASLSACLTDCCRIIYLTLCIMHAEYAYAEACWAASWLHAATHVLFRGTTAERQFTYRLLTGDGHDHLARVGHAQGAPPPPPPGHWRGMSLIASLLLWWLWRVLRPFRRHGVVGVALSGLPVFGGLVGVGTAHVVRYSNKYFIWLEMSEMLLTWVWLALGLALVAVWRLCDQ
ncbi:hypothetical protein V2A60_009754 [Cordyceps javanica]